MYELCIKDWFMPRTMLKIILIRTLDHVIIGVVRTFSKK